MPSYESSVEHLTSILQVPPVFELEVLQPVEDVEGETCCEEGIEEVLYLLEAPEELVQRELAGHVLPYHPATLGKTLEGVLVDPQHVLGRLAAHEGAGRHLTPVLKVPERSPDQVGIEVQVVRDPGEGSWRVVFQVGSHVPLCRLLHSLARGRSHLPRLGLGCGAVLA